ncbi:hypothetical protein HHI36_004110, partial [Cryptolaemus montrouzieri]
MQTGQNLYKTSFGVWRQHLEPILHKGRGESSKKSDKNPHRNQAATLSPETQSIWPANSHAPKTQ